jgi:putative glutathione S-transferase
VEKILSDGREFMFGGKLTEADIRLWVTMIRFDPVYVTHFKCNIATIRAGYPNINKWMLNLYWKGPNSSAFKDTTDFESIKYHYFQSHPQVSII